MKKLITLLILFVGMVSSVSAEDMYIVGDAPFGGWKTNVGTSMTDNGDGTFTYEYTPASDATVYFCIASELTSGASEWSTFNPKSFRPTTKGTKFVQFEPITLSSTDGANSVGMDFKGGVTYTFKFTKSTKELVVFSSVVPDLYLRSNIDATSENSWKTWDADFSALGDYKFTSYGWDSDSKKLKYSYNVTSDNLASMIACGNNDLSFRIQNDDNSMPQMRPNGDYTFSFSDGKYAAGYDGYSNNGNYTGTSSKFIVSHSSIKASEYRITVYVGCYNWGRSYNTSVEIVSMPVTIGSTGFATFSCDRALDFYGKGITANIITAANKATGMLTKVAKTQVPANTGLFLEGSEGTVEVPVLASADAIAGNMLVAGPGTTVNQTADGYTNFILTTNNGASKTPKFFKVNSAGNEVAQGKAYLRIPTSELNARSFFWFEDETTAIEAVKQEIKANGEFFNLAGQRVAQPTKGLYIVNGKKVIMK